MPILFLIAAGATLSIVLSKRKRRKRTGAARTVYTISARNINPGTAPKLYPERERQKICRDYNRCIKAELEKRQAADDITHLEQRKADLLKAYAQLPDNNDERTIKHRIVYDNAIRNTEKQIERAYMILHRTY